MTKPGGTVVVGDPDWRSFQIDVTGAGAGGADSGVGGVAAEAGRRWGEHRRPPPYVTRFSSFWWWLWWCVCVVVCVRVCVCASVCVWRGGGGGGDRFASCLPHPARTAPFAACSGRRHSPTNT